MEWLCGPSGQGSAGCYTHVQACDPCHGDSLPAAGGAAPGPAPAAAAAHGAPSLRERTGLDGFDARSERWQQKAAAMQFPAVAELATLQAHREEQRRAITDYMDAGLFRPAPCALLSSAACAPVLAHAPDARGGAAEESLGQRETAVQMQGGRPREQKQNVVVCVLDARRKIDEAWRHERFCRNRIAAADWDTALAHLRAGQDLLNDKSLRVAPEADQVDFSLLRAVSIRAWSSPRRRCAPIPFIPPALSVC